MMSTKNGGFYDVCNPLLFDYQLVRKRDGRYIPKGVAEIEHVKTNAQSAPSDHLPIRAVYELSEAK